MRIQEITQLLEEHGVKPTANRLLIAAALRDAERPLTMTELEDRIGSIDKSGIFRTLILFRSHHLVHTIEEEEGLRYELCLSHDHDNDNDTHVHFHCVRCGRTFCLEDIPIPETILPDGYRPETVTYLVKGICPDCG